jgi:hypothetical protein
LEVHIHSYWSPVRRSDGTVYGNEEAYFREVLRLTSWRTAHKRLAIGRVLASFAESERALLRAAIAQVGLAKATPNPVGIFLAGCRECLPEWEIQAVCRPRAGGREQHLDIPDGDPQICPRGQNCGASSC